MVIITLCAFSILVLRNSKLNIIRKLITVLFAVFAISLFILCAISIIHESVKNDVNIQISRYEIMNDPDYNNISRIREYNETYSKYAFWNNSIFDIFISDKYIEKGYIIK
jgi:hypothetical protein